MSACELNLGGGRFAFTDSLMTCPRSQFTGRGLFDRNDTLWASWAITSPEPSGGSVWFAGDTGYRTVPRGYSLEQERTLPVCPAFKQIGERFAAGGKQFAFDVAFLPIGAYHPRSVLASGGGLCCCSACD